MTSSVREGLLKTSAPIGSIDRTADLASAPESTSKQLIPLRSNAAIAVRIRSSEASLANSATAFSLGPLVSGSLGIPMPEGALMAFAPEFCETPVDQCHGHGSLADGPRAPVDRSAANGAGVG